MTDTELTDRIEILETRLMHQEATLDELTRTLLKQEQQLAENVETIRRLETLVKSVMPANQARPEDETPPPHY